MSQQEYDPIIIRIKQYWKRIVIVLVVVIIAFNGFFQVGPEEVGVITRFGRYTKTVDPGLNIKVPFIDRLYKVPVERQQKEEFGFRTVNADVNSTYSRSGVARDEALMLTGDLNLADVEWVVQYRISDPYNFLFKVRNPEESLRDIAEAAMRQIVGDRTVNEVLTIGRAEVAAELQRVGQELCNEYSLGIRIDQVVLQDVNPPEPVKAAFNAVNQAQQEKETLINNAKSNYNKIIPKAKGQAKETIQKAEGYASARVNTAQGEVAAFNALYNEYIKAKDVTKKRLYLETMEEILPKMGKKIIVDEDGKSVLPLLNLK